MEHQSEEQQQFDDDEKNDDDKKKKKKNEDEGGGTFGRVFPDGARAVPLVQRFPRRRGNDERFGMNGERLRNCCAKDAEREVRERNVRELLGCDAEEAKRMCEELEKDFADVPYDPARHFFPPTIAMGRPVAMSERQREHHRGEETVGGALMREIPPDGYRNPLFPSWYDRSPTNDRWRHGFGREYYADDDEEEKRTRATTERTREKGRRTRKTDR